MKQLSHICIPLESRVASASFVGGAYSPGTIFSVEETTSALDEAHRMGDALPLWGSVLAKAQTAGRGQMRRHWHSPPGNIYAALRLPQSPPFNGTEAAPALGALLTAVLREMGLDVCLKWPNDLVLLKNGEPCKVGGVLLEERQGRLLAGVGLNRLWAPPEAELRPDHALCACHLNGFAPPLQPGDEALGEAERLWRSLVSGVYFWYTKKLRSGCPWQLIAEAHMLWKGVPAVLSDGDRQVHGVVQGFGPSGGVRLVTDGHVEEFLSGSLTRAAGHNNVPEGQSYE